MKTNRKVSSILLALIVCMSGCNKLPVSTSTTPTSSTTSSTSVRRQERRKSNVRR